jgi:Ser/Thr protein kinase RdoA (MazF antagonist)
MTTSRLNRDLLKQTLRGYAEVNRITEAERRARLKRMTDHEARAIFEGLYQGVYELTSEERARLMPLRVAHHLKVRQAMRRLAVKRGYGSTF